MVKRALLIGINYPGTPVELRGCVNDVRRMQRCLIERFGFPAENIKLLIDTDKSGKQPTGKNICDELKELIKKGEAGDTLVVHYSGHGKRIQPEKDAYIDSTRFDECITPCDMNLIMDNDFKDMVAKVKEGCRLTIISDSCHSGGLIEEAKEQIGESHTKQETSGLGSFLVSIVINLLGACGISSAQGGGRSGYEIFEREDELENGETVNVKPRFLTPEAYISLLEQQTGQTNIKFSKIRPTLVKVFGEDASPNVLSNSEKKTSHRGIFGLFHRNPEVKTGESGTKKSVPDKGILLSGCQTDQRSEDVYVVRTGKAYGAFSDAIQTILSGRGKDDPISNYDMVKRARNHLKKQNFSQRPGLYCHDRDVNKPFIC